ncbi:MAG: adenosylcobinamide-phosphate synthase CbiB [Clostridia bacterium]
MLIQSSLALLLGFLLDIALGDPRGIPHITVATGKLIAALEKLIRKAIPKSLKGELFGGTLLVFITLLFSVIVPFSLLFIAYSLSPWVGMLIETLFCWQLLAIKDLKVESMAVYERLKCGDLIGARKAVSMIVGRDTKDLDKTGVIKADIETIAESTSDGIIAPLFYMMIGGAVFGCLYKAVNTMDSMIGYKNEKYLNFGRTAARLDDFFNFVPARLAALLMLLSCYLTGLDEKNALRIYRRDKRKHESPNSAHTEAVCAGALKVRLAGDAYYFGKLHKKPFIGDDMRPVEINDIELANRLMLVTSILMILLALLLRAALIGGLTYAAL